MLAERWTHAQGDLGEVTPRDVEVVLLLQGSLRVRRRGDGRLQQHDAAPGTLWLCPAGLPEDMIHLYGPIHDCLHLYLPAEPLAAASEDFDCDPDGVGLDYAGGFRDPRIEGIGRAVASELDNDDPGSGLRADTLAATLSVYLLRNFSNRDLSRKALPAIAGALSRTRLLRVLDYIDANLGADLALKELAREACLSPFHFARCFKATTGTSPHAFVLERRLQRARHLIETLHVSFDAVASVCGFSSPSHLASVFKRWAGRTPGSHRALFHA